MTSFSDFRIRAGLTVSETESLLKLSVETIAEYENGARIPTPREIQILKGLALGQAPNHLKSVQSKSATVRSRAFAIL